MECAPILADVLRYISPEKRFRFRHMHPAWRAATTPTDTDRAASSNDVATLAKLADEARLDYPEAFCVAALVGNESLMTWVYARAAWSPAQALSVLMRKGNILHPRDSGYTFDEGRHVYSKNGKECIASVSSLKNSFMPPFVEKEVIARIKSRPLRRQGFYRYMDKPGISAYFKQRRDRGSLIHNTIEDHLRGILRPWAPGDPPHNDLTRRYTPTPHASPVYEDYVKYTKFLADLEACGWTQHISEKRIYADNPYIGGTIDYLAWRVYEGRIIWLMVDWKRCRSPHWEDESAVLKPPFDKHIFSVHLEHSVQMYTYAFILEEYYKRSYFPFRMDACRYVNVVFNPKMPDDYVIEAMDVAKEVREMFALFRSGKVKIVRRK